MAEKSETPTPAPQSATPMAPSIPAAVRAAGSDLDDMGPPGPGRFYLVLEIPQRPPTWVHEAMVSGRIRITEASNG